MKYLHYVCQKYVVALEATGVIKTERLANPCSISFANPTFTFSLVVWDKFCGQGAKNTCSTSKRNMAAPGQKILTQLLQDILLHLGQVHQGRMKMHRKNREPGKSRKAVSWASNSKLLFATKQDFLFIFAIFFSSNFLFLTKLQDLCPQWAPQSLTGGNKEYFSIVKQFLTIYVPGTDLDIIFLNNRQGHSSVL